MSKKKKKIIFGMSLILVAVWLFIASACMLDTIAEATNIITIKQGITFMGIIVSGVASVASLIGGIWIIVDALDVF